jgi:hypothetical protein
MATRGALAFIAILACASGARTETLVQLDYGRRTDNRAASCTLGLLAEEPWRRFACVDPVRDFENYAERLDTQFLGNLLCHGFTFIRHPLRSGSENKLTLEEANTLLERPHWWFILDPYKVGDDDQWWHLRSPEEQWFAGSGKIDKITGQVCSLVGNRGGQMIR